MRIGPYPSKIRWIPLEPPCIIYPPPISHLTLHSQPYITSNKVHLRKCRRANKRKQRCHPVIRAGRCLTRLRHSPGQIAGSLHENYRHTSATYLRDEKVEFSQSFLYVSKVFFLFQFSSLGVFQNWDKLKGEKWISIFLFFLLVVQGFQCLITPIAILPIYSRYCVELAICMVKFDIMKICLV